MDFNSLAIGSPIYILHKSDKPQLIVGSLKDKTQPQAKYQAQAVPNDFNGTNIQQVFTLTITYNGKDEQLTDVPINYEIVQRGNDVLSCNRDAMLQAVDAMIQSSKKSLEMVDYHKSVLIEGEKMLEELNPRYAEEKKRDKTITELEKRQAMTDQKLTSLETQNAEMLEILRKMSSGSPKMLNT